MVHRIVAAVLERPEHMAGEVLDLTGREGDPLPRIPQPCMGVEVPVAGNGDNPEVILVGSTLVRVQRAAVIEAGVAVAVGPEVAVSFACDVGVAFPPIDLGAALEAAVVTLRPPLLLAVEDREKRLPGDG